MKKIALSLLVALSCISAKAADGKSLFVSFNDGSKVEFALSTLPEVTFGNDKMKKKKDGPPPCHYCQLRTVEGFYLHLWNNHRYQTSRNEQQVCLRR